jgi:signal transduction histidine kinase
VCNHEMLDRSPSASDADVLQRGPSTRSTPRSAGRRVGDPEVRLARLPAEPIRAEPSARELQHAIRREACANAVAHDRERIANGLYDNVIHRLFAAGLQLQATCQVVDAPTQARIETTIDLLDSTIAELRKAIFSLH